MSKTTGAAIVAIYDAINVKPQYLDENTGEKICQYVVRAAMAEELNSCSPHEVWMAANNSESKDNEESAFVRTR